MSYLNKVTLIGNIGQEPEIKTFDNGGKIAMFSLATSKSYKQDNGESKSITQWHKIVVRNKNLIEYIIEKGYLKKGIKVYLEGEIITREYKDKENNTMRTTEIIVNTGHQMQILTSKENATKKNIDESIDDEIPF